MFMPLRLFAAFFFKHSSYLNRPNFFMPVIAFDLGGTKLAAALFSDEGEILFSETVSLEGRTGRDVGKLIVAQAILLLKKAAEQNYTVKALGICVPGIAYAKTGNVWAPNIPGWDNYPLREELESALIGKNISVHIDSDRACYILGELWRGNARGCSDAVFLAAGTGIGAGILVNGEVLRGAYDVGGAIGWLALDRPYNKKYISCGCFEYNASGEGIVKVTKELMQKEPQSLLYSMGIENIKAKDVFAAADKGDALAIKVLDNAIECWGMAVANLVSLFNPEKIIFGGGVFGPALKYLDKIYDEAKKWAQPISITQVQLTGSALGAEAGLYGAGLLALKNKSINYV